jgi:hypothetical protein
VGKVQFAQNTIFSNNFRMPPIEIVMIKSYFFANVTSFNVISLNMVFLVMFGKALRNCDFCPKQVLPMELSTPLSKCTF